ncbi:MAG: histidine kinase, partial [Terriglobales bacterium]
MRILFARLTATLLAYCVGSTLYGHALIDKTIPGAGSWFDLGYSVPLAMATISMTTWNPGPASLTESRAIPRWHPYAASMLPTLAPILVAVLVYGIYPAQPKLALLVGIASFACSLARQALTQINQWKALKALRASEKKFAVAFKQSSSAVVINSLTDGRFLEVNDAFVAFYGAPREAVIGKTALELGVWVDLEQRERVMQEIRELGRIRDCEAQMRNKSGEIRTVLFHGDVLNVPSEQWLLVTVNDVTEARRAEAERVKLLGDLISAEEEERRRIARELHDGTGQALTSLLLQLRALQQARSLDKVHSDLDLLRKSTADAVEDLRRISRGLHPTVLDDFGLVPALRRLAEDTAADGNLKVQFSADGLEQVRLPRTVEVAVYRTVQEALHNVVKHAAAGAVQVSLQRTNGELRVMVTDDGAGFEVEPTLRRASQENRLGLMG